MIPIYTGSNLKDIKLLNRSLIIKLISTNKCLSRADLARHTGLTKMTTSNIVSQLISMGIVEEKEAFNKQNPKVAGRKPIQLDISTNSPYICGMLIKRQLISVVLADLKGRIINSIEYSYENSIASETLIKFLLDSFNKLNKLCNHKIIAIGISSIGPVDTNNGIILNPTNFFNPSCNLNIVDIIQSKTSLATFLINDASAGALAEKLFGFGKDYSNFIYLHIMNGVGTGFILDNKLFKGDIGQNGEIGHTSINFHGPVCSCGNRGCLELYANNQILKKRIDEMHFLFPNHPLLSEKKPTWLNIVDLANSGDNLSITLLYEFCSYISHALVNLINLLDTHLVIIGYDSNTKGTAVEDILYNKINSSVLSSTYLPVQVLKSDFGGDAPLIGSIALVADQVFQGNLDISKLFQ